MSEPSPLLGLHGILDLHAATHPESLAAVDAGGAWTYRELRDASASIAALLCSQGCSSTATAPQWTVHPLAPRPVAIAMPRGRLWYALCCACWRLGIPVAAASDDMPDKAAERERGARIARELKPLLAIVAGDPQDAFPGLPSDCRVLSVEYFQAAVDAGVSGRCQGCAEFVAAASAVSPESPLLYCYTGGTTKHSKCAVITHAMALWEMAYYPVVLQGSMSRADRVLQYTSAYWGASAFGQLDMALAFGSCAVFVPTEPGAQGLALAVEEYEISVLGIVPSLLRAMYPGGPRSKPACLKVVLTWGEKLQVKISRPWQELCTVIELLIATEYWLALHSDCTTWLDPADGQEKHVLRALPGLDMLLVGEDGTPVPASAEGSEGELLIAGSTISPGYIDAAGQVGSGPESLAAECWVQGQRYWRTHDRLKWLAGGGLVYCGRAGTLAKRGGAWIDLEALEASVAAVEGVAAAAVVWSSDGVVDTFLVLEDPYWISWDFTLGQVLDKARRASGAGSRLHVHSDLPLHAATGKVERRRLQAMLEGVTAREAAHKASLASVQRRVLQSYLAWYPLVLVLVASPGLLFHALQPEFHAVGLLAALALRLFLLPYLWAAFCYASILPKGHRYDRHLGQADLLLFSAAVLPARFLCTALLGCCAVITWARHHDWGVSGSLLALSLAGLVTVLLGPQPPMMTQLLWCVGCCAVLSALPGHARLDRGFLLGLPASFYIVLPKWLGDDWLWRLRYGGSWAQWLRQKVAGILVLAKRPEWDASWDWKDNGRAAALLKDSSSNVRASHTHKGLSLTVDFWEDVRPIRRAGSIQQILAASTSCEDPAAPAAEEDPLASALAALVKRAGGNSSSLSTLDSLQAIVLAELIRKDLGLCVSVADVLRSADVTDLAARLASAPGTGGDKDLLGLGAPDASGAYRVFALQFPRHPVDWCLRYTGPGHVDVGALQRAVDRVVARHSALRTVETPDEPLREAMDKAAAVWQLSLGCSKKSW
ncbi:unnamed protein product, partial [Polarella glacialis]